MTLLLQSYIVPSKALGQTIEVAHKAALVIDRTSPVPIYHQIKQILLKELRTNPPDPGAPFVTEEALLQRFNVSRTPIRQALKELVHEGYLYRERAKGTFPVSVTNASHRLGGLVQHLRDQGLDPHSRVSDIGWVQPPEQARLILGLASDAKAFAMTRLVLVDNKPIEWGRTYLDIPDDFQATERELEEAGTILVILERRYGFIFPRGEQQIWASAATAEDIQPLGGDVGEPILVAETTTFSQDDRAVCWGRYIHRADQFRYIFPIRR